MASLDTQNVVVNSKSVDDSSAGAHAKSPNAVSALGGSNDGSSAPAVQPPHSSITAASNDKATHANGNLDAHEHGAQTETAHVNGHGIGNGNGHPTDQASVADTASVQGSVQDVDSRDAGSVGDVGISDTDSRGGIAEHTKDANGNIKASSVKKPTTFKAVSVTKTFLAKTAATTPIAKLGDKAIPSPVSTPQSMAKPRLIAKSGSGLTSASRPKPGADGAVDGAATVWNKNRPAPPPPPKQFTDEELKQQYGIHLASRIQDDGGSKQSKWADIDDEEDDWAPETVEWMDGTKSKISTEPVPTPKPAEEERPLAPKSNMTPLKRPSATGPPKTILRPGAAQIKQDTTAAGKDAPGQKNAPAIKAAAPVPAKSPWAELPPVDKSIPMFQPPPPPPPSNKPAFGSQDARFMDGSSPVVRHEIEADTFDRSWRDATGPRELFNSHSGRYEPAPEGRRPSVRQDQGHRQPAVLRRPSDVGDESSPSVQRSQMDGSPWSRRRSSVSQNEAFDRRVSNPAAQQGTDAAPPSDTRTGIVIGHDIGPKARKDSNAAAQRAQQMQNERAEELARQKKVMQEKREAAIRRKREEEEAEEAAKRERIRKKLEELGVPPPSENAKNDQARAKAESSHESHPTEAQPIVAQPPTPSAPADTTVPSQNAPAGPLRAGQSQAGQYQQSLSPPKAQSLQAVQSDPGTQPHTSSATYNPQSSHIQRTPSATNRALQDTSVPVSSYSSPGEHKAQPQFKSPALDADSFASWGNRSVSGHGAPTSNVWGPPGPTRYIGNGAFDTSLSRIPPRLQNQAIMGPSFGPQGNRSPSTGHRQQETSPMRHQQMLSDQNLASLGLVDTPTEDLATPKPSGSSPLPGQVKPAAVAPIGPPQTRADNQPFQQQVPKTGLAAWAAFAAAGRAQAEKQSFGLFDRQPIPLSSLQNIKIKETMRNVTYENGKRVTKGKPVVREFVLNGTTTSPAPPVSQTQQTGVAPAAESVEKTVRLPVTSVAQVAQPQPSRPQRGSQNIPSSPYQSKFFPINLNGGSPPPEDANHPAHHGKSARPKPKVNLPRAKPLVRLPHTTAPVDVSVNQQHVIMPERPSSTRGHQPLAANPDWQAKINGLFGRINTTTATPPSPPKTPPKTVVEPSLAPVASSKTDTYELPNAPTATVSLPSNSGSSVSDDIGASFKPMADVLFDGELSFGSTPKVKVPTNAKYNFGPERSRGVHLLSMRPSEKFDRRVVSTSSVTMDIKYLVSMPPHVATIKMSPDADVKTVTLRSADKNSKSFEKRKVSGKFAKSPKILPDHEHDASPSGTPAKFHNKGKFNKKNNVHDKVAKQNNGKVTANKAAA